MENIILNIKKLVNSLDDNYISQKIQINCLLDSLNQKTKYFYYLTYKGNKLTINISSNYEQDCCNEYTYELCQADGQEQPWVTTSILNAICVKYNNIPWFNSTYKAPVNSFNSKDIQIVRSDGKICNCKPITNITVAKIKDFIYDTKHYSTFLQKSGLCCNDVSFEELEMLIQEARVKAKIIKK